MALSNQALIMPWDGDVPISPPVKDLPNLPTLFLLLFVSPSTSTRKNLAPPLIILLCLSTSCWKVPHWPPLHQAKQAPEVIPEQWGATKPPAGSNHLLSLSFPRDNLHSLQRVPMISPSAAEHDMDWHGSLCPQGVQALFAAPDVPHANTVFPLLANRDIFGFVFHSSHGTVVQMGPGPCTTSSVFLSAQDVGRSPRCSFHLPSRCPWKIPALQGLLTTRITPQIPVHVLKDTSVLVFAVLYTQGCVSSVLEPQHNRGKLCTYSRM